jgi:hypothetical protein
MAMNSPLGMAVCAVLLLGPVPAISPAASDDAGAQAVKCQLPPQVRRLGRQTSYLAAGRIVSTTAADCRVRGGQARAIEAAAASPPPAADGRMAVMVGGSADAPACPVSGRIIGLKDGSTLSVRAGPGTQHARLDRLANGRGVHVCDGTPDEAWLGIVYPRSAGQDCGVDAPVDEAQAYAGACAVGWVNAGWVQTDAAKESE